MLSRQHPACNTTLAVLPSAPQQRESGTGTHPDCIGQQRRNESHGAHGQVGVLGRRLLRHMPPHKVQAAWQHPGQQSLAVGGRLGAQTRG
jgi:hypothetical protein